MDSVWLEDLEVTNRLIKMQQRIKVQTLAKTRKKHRESITSVVDGQEEKASDSSRTDVRINQEVVQCTGLGKVFLYRSFYTM